MLGGAGEYDENARHSFAIGTGGLDDKAVAYFYDPDVGSYYYGQGHPMKPQRIRMAHSLILGYDFYKHMEVYRPHAAEHSELTAFHDSEYVNFLSNINVDLKAAVPAGNGPGNSSTTYENRLRRFNLGEADCPLFDGLFEFQSSCAGASVDCARLLNHKIIDIGINWSGGLHHAKRSEASGFCYVNDIVLCIIELLKYHNRVMYIDIDIHHGDGIEEAFYLSNRVMTISFHKFGDFFPGTGDLMDLGGGIGKYYSINVPLSDGIRDEHYVPLYKKIVGKAVEVFRPEVIVLQCGADSITGDRLGNFNLTTKGHGACVEWTKSLNIPLILLGGGGYTIKNVARAWLYETAIAIGKKDEADNRIPVNEYYEYFAPYYNLHLLPDPMKTNKNSDEYLKYIEEKIFKHLKNIEAAPSVPFSHVPPDFFDREEEEDAAQDMADIDWSGGGLATEEVFTIPHRMRRKDHPMEWYERPDRDQRMTRSILNVPVRPFEDTPGDDD